MGLGCIICTEDFVSSSENEEKYPMCIKTCGHVFHKSCLNIWLSKSTSCPICRCTTLNSPSYITKLHFQNLSLDNSNILGLLDETDKLRDELKQKDEIIAKKDKKIMDMAKSFAKLSSTFSAVKQDFKEDRSEASVSSSTGASNSNDSMSVSAALRPRTTVRLVSTRAIQGRAPMPSSSLEQAVRRARVAAATNARTMAIAAARGRSASSGALQRAHV